MEFVRLVETENLALKLSNESLRMQVETLQAEKDMLLRAMSKDILANGLLDVRLVSLEISRCRRRGH